MNSFASPQIISALPLSRRAVGKPSSDDLYSRIFDAILEQRIQAGSRFTEESLGQMFGVRRSEIRGVLTRLSQQQIIVQRANHRPRIAELDAEQTRQTLHARRLAEITLVRLACLQPLAQDMKRLRALIESERHCTQRGRALRLAGEFHLQLAQMAGNAPLTHFLGSLVPLTSLALAQFEVSLEDYCVWQAHMDVLDAVEHGDAGRAQMLLGRHLDRLEEALLNPQLVTSQHCAAD